MTRTRVEGALAPGRYTVTAYGGEKLTWADGAAAQPFFLRLDTAAPMSAGVAEGVIGPFGSARFEAPAEYDSFRLELPQATSARLEARRGAVRQSATIGKTSREPVVTLRLTADGKEAARIEVSGYRRPGLRLARHPSGKPPLVRGVGTASRVARHRGRGRRRGARDGAVGASRKRQDARARLRPAAHRAGARLSREIQFARDHLAVVRGDRLRPHRHRRQGREGPRLDRAGARRPRAPRGRARSRRATISRRAFIC